MMTKRSQRHCAAVCRKEVIIAAAVAVCQRRKLLEKVFSDLSWMFSAVSLVDRMCITLSIKDSLRGCQAAFKVAVIAVAWDLNITDSCRAPSVAM